MYVHTRRTGECIYTWSTFGAGSGSGVGWPKEVTAFSRRISIVIPTREGDQKRFPFLPRCSRALAIKKCECLKGLHTKQRSNINNQSINRYVRTTLRTLGFTSLLGSKTNGCISTHGPGQSIVGGASLIPGPRYYVPSWPCGPRRGWRGAYIYIWLMHSTENP